MDDIRELLDITRSNGFVVPDKLAFFQSDDKGICCRATENVEDLKLQLPNKFILTNSISNKHFADLIQDTDCSNTWFKLLLSKLRFSAEDIRVGNDDIRPLFGTYIRSLPSVVDSPLMWNPSELQLLKGTNLLNSLKEKWSNIYGEWHKVVNNISIKTKEYNVESMDFEQIYKSIVLKILDSSNTEWFSFPAFLWAHLICTSRAFPERVINPVCPLSNIVLLPVLDLLNHGTRTTIEWSSNEDGDFIFKFPKTQHAESEVTNNYGAKGNEELLLGYGFVIEGNEFDSFALKIKLQKPILEKLREANVPLPVLEDYTTFAFDSNSSHDTSVSKSIPKDQDDVLFFVTHDLESLKPLLQLFAHIYKNDHESHMNLRCQLTSIQSLRNSLKHKLSTILEDSEYISSSSQYEVSTSRRKSASIYKTAQISILTSSIDNLKMIQKHLMKTYKSHLATISNILKYDTSFWDHLSELFQKQSNPPELETDYDKTIAWIALRSKKLQKLEKYNWVLDQFLEYTSTEQRHDITPNATALYNHFFPSGHTLYDVQFMASILDYIDNFAFMKASASRSDFDDVPVLTKHLEVSFL